MKNRDDEIRKTILAWLSPEAIEGVRIEDGFDSDDEPVLNIMVITRPGQKIDKHKMLSLTRHLQTKIDAAAMAFPIIDYMSSGDAKKRAAA